MRLVVRFQPVVLALVALLTMPAIASAQEATPAATAISGSFDVGGHRVHIDCIGSGRSTIVFAAGQEQGGASFLALQQEFAKEAMACTYDRSLPPSSTASPPTAADVVADLYALLTAAGVPGPYVLVGQSVGGVFVQLYARTYPGEVAGVVAMNPVPPAGPWTTQAMPLMTEEVREGEEAYYRGEDDADSFDWYTSFDQLDAAPPPPDIPFEMLISTIVQCDSPDDICGRTYAVYESIMHDVANDWPQGNFTEVEAGHATWGDAFDETIAVIRRALPAAGGSAATPLPGTPAT